MIEKLFSPPVFAQINVPPGIPVVNSGDDPSQRMLWGGLIPGIIQLLLFITFIVAFIFLILGGISWMTSGGNKEALEGAKKKITYAILGLIFVLASFAIIYIVGGMFGINLRGG